MTSDRLTRYAVVFLALIGLAIVLQTFQAVLRPLARELDRAVAALEESGELGAERERGDFQQRYPHEWVKVHQLLARLGDDESLQKLVDRFQLPESQARELESGAIRPGEPGAL